MKNIEGGKDKQASSTIAAGNKWSRQNRTVLLDNVGCCNNNHILNAPGGVGYLMTVTWIGGQSVMSSINKRDLVKRISKNIDCKQFVVRDIVQNIPDEMLKELSSGNRLEFREFGIFQPKVH